MDVRESQKWWLTTVSAYKKKNKIVDHEVIEMGEEQYRIYVLDDLGANTNGGGTSTKKSKYIINIKLIYFFKLKIE